MASKIKNPNSASKAPKRVVLDNEWLLYGTSIKSSIDTNTSTVSTFDKVIPQGTNTVGYSLEMSYVQYQSITDYKYIRASLIQMLSQPKEITVAENIYTPSGNYVIRRYYHECLLESSDFEIKPEERTITNLKFKAASMEEEVEELK